MSEFVASGARVSLRKAGRSLRALAMGSTSAAVMAVVLGAAPAVHAQEAAAPGPAALDEVVVTGSRIARRDYVATSPIVTVGAESLETSGGATLESKLNQLPQFTPGQNAFTGSGAATGQATLNLRGLGASRNLILLDGRRLQPSSSSVVVDINTIPSGLIENVEVISGGASAVYGSDAVAGVVNFRLKRNFQGLELNAQYDVTERGDAESKHISGFAGVNTPDGRGNFVMSLDYLDRGGAYLRDRDFYRSAFPSGTGTFSNAAIPFGLFAPATTNLPSQAAVNSLFAGYGVAPGAVARTTSLGFNNDGSLFSVSNGVRNYRGPINDALVVTSTGALFYNSGTVQLLQTPLTRYAGFARGEYEITEHVKAYAQVLYTQYDSVTNSGAASAQAIWSAIVPVTNPTIPTDLRTLLASRPDPTAPFTLNKRFTQVGPLVTEHENTVYQVLAGLSGSLPNSDWTWEVYGSTGRTELKDTITEGGLSISAINGVLSAPGGGAGGPCGVLNLFGDRPIGPECIRFLSRQPRNIQTVEQDIVEATIQGGLFELPAGQLRFAAGADWRRNAYTYEPDPLTTGVTTSDVVNIFPGTRTAGSTTVKEIYGELLIPVLKDLPLMQAFNLDLAYRYSDYDTVGGVHTYKADFDWAVTQAVRLRGGYQRAVRAPNVGELYTGPFVAVAAIGSPTTGGGDPCDTRGPYRRGPNASAVTALCAAQGIPGALLGTFTNNAAANAAINQGNPAVVQETADTFTVGAVWRPTFDHPLAKRLSASIDYYKIDIADAIGISPGGASLSKCFNADGSNPTYSNANIYCSYIERDANSGAIFSLDQLYMNLGGFKTTGIDIQVDWGFDLGAIGLSDDWGGLDFNVVANYLQSFEIQTLPGAPFQDFAGTIGNTTTGNGTWPEWKLTSTAAYSRGGAQLGLRWMYLGKMEDYTKITTPANPRRGVPSYSRYDLFGRYQVNDRLEFRGGVDNLTDKEPLVVGGILSNTDPGSYDPLGRRLYLAVRAKF